MQVPFPLQLPLQHSGPLEQNCADALQHVCAAPHVSPPQQSPTPTQATPIAEHPHLPETPLQTPEQQSVAMPHAVPSVRHPHVPFELQSGGEAVPQQSSFVVHPVPVYPQPHVRLTVLQIWLQHSEAALHPAPSPLQTVSTTH